ncbi:AAC(6')-Ia family aminoglycoside 6'-N-acetyltransferase [Pseudomonas aeruginosa]|uniref:AAC(6')-Ia family aminoglycoside 6'-N-acetyltransferase n=1 Tax=Pseudomonas aeruginosa TaxID=287 RepID=UPI0009A39075|nr:AAC(6')-Ia family aminoglycoside 6'-N-acetyltransferase [Pseudomonas aeruginosa]
MKYTIIDIKYSEKYIDQAAEILFDVFSEINPESWPTLQKAKEDVIECLEDERICIGILINNELIGWIGLREMYKRTWELHPMVIKKTHHSMGFGKILINEIERKAKERDLEGIVLGTDDETYRTSLSMTELNNENIFQEIKNIRNLGNHPYEFYKKCGYNIIGVIPNANGKNKPDIIMWKNLMEENCG